MIEVDQLQFAHSREAQCRKRVMPQNKVALGIHLSSHLPMVNRNVHLWPRIAIPREENRVNLSIMEGRPTAKMRSTSSAFSMRLMAVVDCGADMANVRDEV